MKISTVKLLELGFERDVRKTSVVVMLFRMLC